MEILRRADGVDGEFSVRRRNGQACLCLHGRMFERGVEVFPFNEVIRHLKAGLNIPEDDLTAAVLAEHKKVPLGTDLRCIRFHGLKGV